MRWTEGRGAQTRFGDLVVPNQLVKEPHRRPQRLGFLQSLAGRDGGLIAVLRRNGKSLVTGA